VNDESNIDSEEIQDAIKKTRKELSKGLFSGINKLKQGILEGIEESKIQKNIDEGDVGKIINSSQVMGKAVIKGASKGLSDIISSLATGGNIIAEAVNDKKQKKKHNIDDNND